MAESRKYGVQADIYFPLIDAGTQNFAVSGDYTHASGDVKVSKDGGAAVTASNSPSAITMGNGAMWKLTLTATEMQAALVVVVVSDAATKAVEDQMVVIETYGNSSALHELDLDTSWSTVADTIWDEPVTEPTAMFAWASFTPRKLVQLLGALSRNKVTQTSGTMTVRNDADSGTIYTRATSDDGTTFLADEAS